MPRDFFIQRKKAVLSKLDKSSKGGWDKKIVSLCNKINSMENYYTTSSCSGRALLIIDKEKKQGGLFCKVYHDLISLADFKKDLKEICRKFEKEKITFKQEPPILHVACRTLNDADFLYEKAKLAGWKKSGLVSWQKRFILELNSTEKLELPIIRKGKLLGDDKFLKIIVKQSNLKMKNSWGKIKKLEKAVRQGLSFKSKSLY